MTKKKIIPKRIAGVKLPKELRRAGNAALEHAQTPQGREMIAAGLSMAAAAATAAVVRARADRAGPPAPGEPGVPPVPPQAGVEAMGQMAEMVLGRLFAKR